MQCVIFKNYIKKKFLADIKQNGLNRYAYGFLFVFGSINAGDIHNVLIKKNNMK